MKKRQAMLKGVIFASAVGFASAASAGPTLWIGDWQGNLGKVDATTGVASVIGNMGNTMTDIAFDPSGNLYGITTSSLYKINTSDASTTLIGSLGAWSSYKNFNSLVFSSSGTLYSVANNYLFTINTTTGQASYAGSSSYPYGMNSAGDLAFAGGKLYLSSYTYSADTLWVVDPSNFSNSYPANYPSATYITDGSTNYQSVFGLASPDNVHLYGVDGTTILDINRSNGFATVLANYGGQGLEAADGSAFYTEAGAVLGPTNPVPEPETYAMMLAGLGLLGFMARRRKQTLD